MTEHCIVIIRPIELYEDNPKTPYFWRGKKEFQMEVVDILQLNVDSNRICTERPLSVTEDAAFVIDTRELVARKDYLVDNIGNFRNLGHCGKIFKLTCLMREAVWISKVALIYSEAFIRSNMSAKRFERKVMLTKWLPFCKWRKRNSTFEIFSGHLNLEWLFSQKMYCKM